MIDLDFIYGFFVGLALANIVWIFQTIYSRNKDNKIIQENAK